MPSAKSEPLPLGQSLPEKTCACCQRGHRSANATTLTEGLCACQKGDPAVVCVCLEDELDEAIEQRNKDDWSAK